jgi:lysophospholipase L1-like esterase
MLMNRRSFMRNVTIAAVAAASRPAGLRAQEAPIRMQAASKCGFPDFGMSDGKSTEFNARMSMQTQLNGVSWSNLVLRYINCNAYNKANGNALTIRAAVEYPAGVFDSATWQDGSDIVTLQPGQYVDSLPIPVTIPANTRFWVRVHGVVPAAGKWPLYSVMTDGNSGSGQEQGNALPDKSHGGSIANAGLGPSWLPPLSVTGEPADPAGCAGIGILGDSISVGANDSTYSEFHGFAQRALGHNWGWINLGEAGYQLSNFGYAAGRQWRWMAMPALTHVFTNLGTNDLSQKETFPTMQYNLKTINSSLWPLGIRLIPATLTPRTSASNTGPRSTDAPDVFAVRQHYNSWIRSNPLGHGFVDLAAVTEAGVTGLWRTDLGAPSVDGIHPSTALHTAMKTQLYSSLCGLLFTA